MIDSESARARGFARPSRSRTQEAKRPGRPWADEDAELRSAERIIRVRGGLESVIEHPQHDLPPVAAGRSLAPGGSAEPGTSR